jgi:hypothetical protein
MTNSMTPLLRRAALAVSIAIVASQLGASSAHAASSWSNRALPGARTTINSAPETVGDRAVAVSEQAGRVVVPQGTLVGLARGEHLLGYHELPHHRAAALLARVLHGRPPRLRVRFRMSSGRWGPPHRVADGGHTARWGVLVGDDRGNLLAAWAWHNPAGWVVQMATRTQRRGFAAPLTLSAPDGQAPEPVAAMAPDGRAVVSWAQGGRRRALLTTVDGPLGDPLDVGPADLEWNVAGASAGPDGRLAVTWAKTVGDSGDEQVWLAEAPPGMPLSTGSDIARTASTDIIYSPVLGLGPNGRAILLTAASDPKSDTGASGLLRVQVRPQANAPFGEPQVLSSPNHETLTGGLAVGPHGEAVAGWYEGPRSGPGDGALLAATLTASFTAFSAPEVVTPGGDFDFAAIGPDGRLLLTWTDRGSEHREAVHYAQHPPL